MVCNLYFKRSERKEKCKVVEGGNIYLYQKNWTSKLIGGRVIGHRFFKKVRILKQDLRHKDYL